MEKNAPAHSWRSRHCSNDRTTTKTERRIPTAEGVKEKNGTTRREREGKKERPPTRDREREKTQVRRGEQSWRRIGKSDLGAGTAVLSEEKKRKSGEKEAVPYCGPAFVPKTSPNQSRIPKLTTVKNERPKVKRGLLRKMQTPNRPMNHSLPFFEEILVKMRTDGRYQNDGDPLS